ncbi:glycosyltransferase family 32 protein [Lactobacillus delbrueckii]|uniref:glycosyltransferase family 32 protein n=1 Tax=Lactobacillus delbrueckii TaxID=1584 RepID=UPI003A8C0806
MSNIPKVINYCWFGGNPLPEKAKSCIESWKKYLPDYEIKEWNEENFDINSCAYTKEAYKAKKWAFVSDYARYWILYNYGGLYFDTDIEIIKPLDQIIQNGPFMACEPNRPTKPSKGALPPKINSGLGLGATSHMVIYKEILDYYNKEHFINTDGTFNLKTVVDRVTSIFQRYGYTGDGTIEHVAKVNIYPVDYFCPKNYFTGEIKITNNTVAIHHFAGTWTTKLDKKINKLRFSPSRNDIEYYFKQALAIPLIVVNKIYKRTKR